MNFSRAAGAWIMLIGFLLVGPCGGIKVKDVPAERPPLPEGSNKSDDKYVAELTKARADLESARQRLDKLQPQLKDPPRETWLLIGPGQIIGTVVMIFGLLLLLTTSLRDIFGARTPPPASESPPPVTTSPISQPGQGPKVN
jgi:hypothetical protein